MDDYEEGTWTATLTANTSAPTTPITSDVATYTKVGNLVTVTFTFSGVDTTGASGFVQVTGLPFEVVTGNFIGRAYSAAAIGGMDTDNTTVIARTEAGTTNIHFLKNQGSTNQFLPFDIETTTNAYVGATLTYQAAS